MADTDLSQSDVLESQRFMQQFLLALLPDADITEGSAEHDHLVKGFSFLFAFLRKLVGNVEARQSLLTLVNLTPDQDVNEAADALLANLYVGRDQGRFARGSALIHLSAKTDVVVRSTSRFFKTRALYYLVDASGDFVIPASQLRPNIDASGTVVDWVGTVPLVAARTGAEYNLGPGRFVNFERFNDFVTFVENVVAFSDGGDVESTSAFVDRAASAIAIRALLNARSNTTLLRTLFPIVEQVTTVGYGDAEMVRDVITERSSGLVLHLGGHTDVFVRTPLREVVETLEIGAAFPRPDDRVLIFRHDPSVDFTTGTGLTGGRPVVIGDILGITSGLPEAPIQYRIEAVAPQELRIHPRVPFSLATDEDSSPPVLAYTIGDDYPAFSNKHVGSGLAETSRSQADPNTVMLGGRPVYRVKKVEIRNPPAGYEAFLDPTTGSLLFTERVNTDPATPTPGTPLQFRVVVLNPDENQSARAVTQVVLGWPTASFDGYLVEVTYDSLSTFENIHAYVDNRENRPSAANTLTRAGHPVVLAMTVPYAVNPSPVPFRGTAPVFDEARAAEQLVAFVNTYQGSSVMDVSLIATEVRARADTVAAVYPFEIEYELLGPDGRVFKYRTTDRVTVFPDGTHGAALTNPADFGLPTSGYEAQLATLLRDLGISDRNLRYLANADEVSFERRI